jgi:hypothetical protein
MPSLDQVCTLIQTEVLGIMQANSVGLPPGQVGVGQPFGQSLSEILGQYQAQISIFPIPKAAQNRTSRKPHWVTSIDPPVTLTVQVLRNSNTWTLTFGGVAAGGYNIHTFPNGSRNDCYYQTQANDTLDSVATAVALSITNQSISGISASASGPVATVTGAPTMRCGIGGNCTMIAEMRRTMCPISVKVWAANAPIRNQIGALLENLLAPTYPSPMLTAPDLSYVWVRWAKPGWNDDSQSSYSLYVWEALLEAEYATVATTTGTAVESIPITGIDPNPIYTGGS